MITTVALDTTDPKSHATLGSGSYGVGEMWVNTGYQTVWIRTN